MKRGRTLTPVSALIRALGFITARQIEAHLPKPAGEAVVEDVEPMRALRVKPRGVVRRSRP
jgi:hypothetical protein